MSDPKTSRQLVAGNWKMNLTLDDGLALAKACADGLPAEGVPVVLCTPAPFLHAVREATRRSSRLHVGAQDLSQHAFGAHTGEVAGEQLRSVGCSYVIVGHSERRADHGEAGTQLRDKVDSALSAGLRPIYCFGETLAQRDEDAVERVVADQLAEGLSHLDGDAFAQVVLAYEPVWAIGTGRTASPEQAQEVHAFVRRWVGERFGESRAEQATVLYGGSVKPASAPALFAQADIDGGLIGGASLQAADFIAIAGSYA